MNTRKNPRAKKPEEGLLEEKWRYSYTGTGITATKGEDALALREGIGSHSQEYAIVELTGGCWTTSPMKVIEEIKTGDLNVAKARFAEVVKIRGFEEQPVRGAEVLLDFLFGR